MTSLHDSIEERFRQLAEWEQFEELHNGPSLYPSPPSVDPDPAPWWAEHYDEDPNQQENK
mgnify:CR=1 FL=1